jgi:hypothetical protein
MKTITVTLKKADFRATCVMQYILDNQPEDCVWSGDVDAFRLDNGHPLNFRFPLYRLEAGVVAFQAAQAGAEYIFEDDGGSCEPSRPGCLDEDGFILDLYTATFEKKGRRAVCVLRYWANSNGPMRNEWSGDVDAFRSENGDLPKVDFPQESLESELAAQAERIGAEFTIEYKSVNVGRSD